MAPPFDYANVRVDDLEMRREPRKSQITIVHKPSGAVSENPVVPGSLSPARFRRPTNIPKENRVEGMEGYIEGRKEDATEFWAIVGGENPKNDYLAALAADPEALKISFEGGAPKEGAPEPAAQVPATPTPDPAPEQEVSPETDSGLDDMLAELEST